jgi:nicotinate-nucleotide adenylyltransferase
VADLVPNLPPRPRIGVFGGTFDPPHVGHLVTAVNVRHALALDVVLLVVAGEPWQKEGTRVISPAEDRYALTVAAVGDVDGVESSRIELDQGGPSYTADTLRDLRDAIPDGQFFTVLGLDAAAGLSTWERYEEVVAISRLVVVDRPGSTASLSSGVAWLRVEVPHLEVSSTDLRARVADGRPLDYLLPPKVIAEIEARNLYRGARPAL